MSDGEHPLAAPGGTGDSDRGDAILFADPASLDRLRVRRLAELVQLCQQRHPFYRNRGLPTGVTSRGAAPSRSEELLSPLPLTWKQDFLDDPESFRLAPDAGWPPAERVLHSVMYTTGTQTGVPAPVYNTGSDYYGMLVEARRSAPLLGLSSADRIANVFPLTPFPTGGYVRTLAMAAALGASAVSTHTGQRDATFDVHRSLDDAVALVVRHDVSVIWGIAGFVARLVVRAAELGLRTPNLRMCLITGERATRGMHDRIRAAMRQLGSARASIRNRYGFTEGATLIPCEPGTIWHNVVPDQMILEVVDPGTGERRPEGEIGHLAITHLTRRGTVLLRYVIGDEVELAYGACPNCGITAERVTSTPRRSGSIVKVKATMVDLDALVHALESVPDLVDFQIRLGRAPETDSDDVTITALVVRVVSEPGVEQQVASSVTELVERIAHLRPTVEPVDATRMFDLDTDIKHARVVREWE